MPRPSSVFAAAMLLGGALRLGAAAAYWDAPLSPGGDDRQYVALARSLRSGEGYSLRGGPSAYRAPLYPLFLAAAMGPESAGPGRLRLLQALLGILALWVVFALGRRAHSPSAGAWGALLLALSPEQILLGTSLYCESFYALTLLGVAWPLLRWVRSPGPGAALGLGGALGVSLLTRSVLAPAPLAWLAWRARTLGWRRGFFIEAACLLGMAALLLIPWTARNWIRFGRLIPFEAGVAGPVVWYASQGYLVAPADEAGVEPMKTMFSSLPHTEWDSYALGLAAQGIAAHPFRYGMGCLRRAWRLWTDSYTCYLLHDHPRLAVRMEGGPWWDRAALIDGFFRLAAALLAGLAVWRLRADPAVLALAGLVLFFNIYALGTVFARFHAPVTPLICLLGGIGWAGRE